MEQKSNIATEPQSETKPARKRGRPVRNSSKLYIWVSDSVATALKADADSRWMSMSERVRGIVTDELVRIGRLERPKTATENAITPTLEPAKVDSATPRNPETATRNVEESAQ